MCLFHAVVFDGLAVVFILRLLLNHTLAALLWTSYVNCRPPSLFVSVLSAAVYPSVIGGIIDARELNKHAYMLLEY